MKILLLEDDHTYNESIKESLEEMGYAVDAFEDGLVALDALFEKQYHLALLDIRVPHLDGYEILKEIRKAKLDLPIIFITSLTDINNLSLGYELGCNDYLRKPFSLKELQYRVSQTLKSYHLHTTLDVIPLTHGFSYHSDDQSLWFEEMQVNLSNYERKLLFVLVKIGAILSPQSSSTNTFGKAKTSAIMTYACSLKNCATRPIRILLSLRKA